MVQMATPSKSKLLETADGRSIKGHLLKAGCRRCAKCKIFKPLNEFYNNSATADGKHSYCKPCNRENLRKWKANNPPTSKRKDEQKEYWNKYYQENREIIQQNRLTYNKKNPLESILKAKAYVEFKKARRNGLIKGPFTLCQ